MPEAPRAALYARVSTSGQGQDVGLQLDELRQVARQRGWTVVLEEVDEGISGATRDRPGLSAVLEAARTAQFDLLAVWKLDRLARSVPHLLELGQQLDHWGVDLVSLRDANIDTTSPQGRFSFQILASVAELERALIRERVMAGLERARRQGKRLGRPPAHIDMDAARALRAQGFSIRKTARSLQVSEATLRRRLQAEEA
jgi:DNA invertase Pin-like site-specific DNA recombinase